MATPPFRPRRGGRKPPHVDPRDSQGARPSGQLASRPGPRRREGCGGWGRAPGFPRDRAEAAGSCAAVGRRGREELGAEPGEEGARDEEEDAARAMERAEAGVSVGSPGAPGPEEQGGAGGRPGRRRRRPLGCDRPRPAWPLARPRGRLSAAWCVVAGTREGWLHLVDVEGAPPRPPESRGASREGGPCPAGVRAGVPGGAAGLGTQHEARARWSLPGVPRPASDLPCIAAPRALLFCPPLKKQTKL